MDPAIHTPALSVEAKQVMWALNDVWETRFTRVPPARYRALSRELARSGFSKADVVGLMESFDALGTDCREKLQELVVKGFRADQVLLFIHAPEEQERSFLAARWMGSRLRSSEGWREGISRLASATTLLSVATALTVFSTFSLGEAFQNQSLSQTGVELGRLLMVQSMEWVQAASSGTVSTVAATLGAMGILHAFSDSITKALQADPSPEAFRSLKGLVLLAYESADGLPVSGKRTDEQGAGAQCAG